MITEQQRAAPRTLRAWTPPAPEAPAATDDWPRTRRPMPWALAAFMAMIWLVPFDSVSLPISLPLDAKLDRPLLIGTAGLWLLSLIGDRRKTVSRLRMSAVHWAVLSLVIIALASIVLNDATAVRLNELDPALRKLALLFSYALLFTMVASAIKPTEVRNFTVFMVGLASLTALGALIEFRTGYNVFFQSASHFFSVTRPGELGAVDSIGRKSIIGPTVHPLAVAMMMSLALPFALTGFLGSTERKMKVRYGIATALYLAAAVATQRKTSFIAPAFGMLVLLAYRPRAVVKLVPIAVVLFVVVHIAAPGAIGGITQQLKPDNLQGVFEHEGPPERLRGHPARHHPAPAARTRVGDVRPEEVPHPRQRVSGPRGRRRLPRRPVLPEHLPDDLPARPSRRASARIAPRAHGDRLWRGDLLARDRQPAARDPRAAPARLPDLLHRGARRRRSAVREEAGPAPVECARATRADGRGGHHAPALAGRLTSIRSLTPAAAS